MGRWRPARGADLLGPGKPAAVQERCRRRGDGV